MSCGVLLVKGVDITMFENSLPTDDYVEGIINKYSNMVYKLAFSQTKNKIDADDVFQEVFMRYITSNCIFENEEHEKAWFIRVTINCSRKLWSSAWFRHTVSLDKNVSLEMQEENEIYHVLMKLPLKYRTVIHLFYYEDMPIAQISEIIKVKESTIRAQLTRARTLLKEKLKGDFDYV
jgi:RNA polymerase sigma-70 factor (ECF subfamily)